MGPTTVYDAEAARPTAIERNRTNPPLRPPLAEMRYEAIAEETIMWQMAFDEDRRERLLAAATYGGTCVPDSAES